MVNGEMTLMGGREAIARELLESMDQIVEEEGDAVEYDGGPSIDASSNDTNGIKDDDVNDDKDIRRDKEEVEEDRRHHHRRDDDRHTLTNDKVGA
jgi:hypothetical protein